MLRQLQITDPKVALIVSPPGFDCKLLQASTAILLATCSGSKEVSGNLTFRVEQLPQPSVDRCLHQWIFTTTMRSWPLRYARSFAQPC